MLVLIGATPEGKKELIGFQIGVLESAQSWCELLINVKQARVADCPRNCGRGPRARLSKGARGLCGMRHQRCWVYNTVNILEMLPLSVQAAMKKYPHEVYWAPNRTSARSGNRGSSRSTM
ncbi:transposase [Bradyrhizobium sp. CNPSo 4010]|uniref:Mutator family transposase n=1 Tax=Bradyrhizobium agreste TaxID=2751811 RepID=A0ABS0PH58_9BRAD|nr:transposase [Bradyrhizobium agreste]MBH5396537.1 transposase [Bradyrhizobium agreste]